MKMNLSLSHSLTAYCAILLLIFSVVDAGRMFWEIKERVRQVRRQMVKQLLLADVSGGRSNVKLDKMDQTLDHFNHRAEGTFPQRFLVNDFYWTKPNGPVFLYISGENAISIFDVILGHHVEMAKQHSALLVALEHRFYGRSINPDGLKLENLASLSSQQALVDLAVFHEHISQRFNLTSNNTWVSFGGSYAGALSAWFRREFPHLVFAAVASSAPVRAKLDFSAYSNIVGLGLLNERVGGSQKCFLKVRKAFAALEAAFKLGHLTRVAADFNCCQVPKDLKDQVNLIQGLADIFMGTVQYNEEYLSIQQVCAIMTNKTRGNDTEGYAGLVQLAKLVSPGPRCVDVSYEAMINYLMDTAVGRGSDRQWIYQTCTEFGFYQTCEDAMCPFSRMISLRSETSVCQAVFGISQHFLSARVAFSNMYYGASRPNVHRVLYVNGGLDPWSNLSVVGSCTVDGEKASTVLIPDAAHCADMMSRRLHERVSLQLAQKEIEKYVANWLQMAEERKEKRCD